MTAKDEWTCFEFALPYLLYQLEGPIEFVFDGQRCRLELAHHKRDSTAKTMSVLDDPYGRTDYTAVRICFEGLFAIDLEHLVLEERQPFEERFGRDASKEFNRTIHKFIIDAVNKVVDAYTFAWGAWRLPPIQFVDLTGYSAYYLREGKRPGKLMRSLQPDPDKASLELVRNNLTIDDKAGSMQLFLRAPSELNQYWSLEMAAVRSLFRRDTITASIICVTALEVYVDSVLFDFAEKSGVSVDEMMDILEIDSPRPFTSIRDVLESGRARMYTKLKKGIDKAFGIKLTQGTYWPEWKKLQKARNDAAHSGLVPSVEDTAKGLIAARKIFETIEEARSKST